MSENLDAQSDLAIRTEKLSRRFGEVQAVQNLDLTVRRGELFGLVGPDGAGKTTTMRMLAGILDPTSGDAWIDDVSVVKDPEGIKTHIAYMPQRFGLYQDLTVLENLDFYADLFKVPRRIRAERIEELFGFSRLGPFKDRLAGALSGGMKQKLGLACALIHEPRVLLLDEPTNGVDPVSRRDFWKILYELLKDRISILVSTAYLDEAERTNRVGLMHNGTLIRVGEPQEMKSRLPGFMIELTTSDRSKAREVLGQMSGLLDINTFGDGLHVRISEESAQEAIRTRLEEAGIEIRSLRSISPSIEDTFLHLIRRAQKKQGDVA
jgi:ABC-2 type transport system ATP-binding protein